MRLFSVFVLLLAFTACAPVEESFVASDDGNLYLSAATHAARTAVAERKTATAAAATITRQAFYDDQTATPLAATAEAYTADQTATADLRTSVFVHDQQTDVAHARETETLIARAQASAQASALAATNGTATAEAQASATALAYQTDAPLTALAKDFAAQQMQHQIAQAEADAIRAQSWGDFLDALMKFVVACGSVALLVVLLFALSKYLDSLAMARRLVPTAEGTVLISYAKGKPVAQLIRTVPNLLDAPGESYFEMPPASIPQAPQIAVRTLSGNTFTLDAAPETDATVQLHDSVVRFLAKNIRHYQRLGYDAHDVKRIATWREMQMSAETWTRGVHALGEHVTIQKGRGGGVFCGSKYPNLFALYVAVNENHIALLPPASDRAS